MSDANGKDISKDQKVSKLRNGTVIDHLRPGTALKVIELLGIVDGHILTIGMFFESKKISRKDIVKIENRVLSPDELSRLAIISPDSTVCVIEDYAVTRKFKVQVPGEVPDIIRCNNPKCITNHEKVSSRFAVEVMDPLKVRCQYCERSMAGNEISLI